MGFKKLLERLKISTSEGELSVWMKVFDPLERNEIQHNVVLNYFVN